MVQALINAEHVLKNTPSEEFLLDHSHMEAIYAMRKLTAALRSLHYYQTVLLGEENEHGQRYSEVYQIWFNSEEYLIIKYEE